MADFGGMVLTDVGKNLQAAVQTGEELNFVRIALGDGVLPSGGDLETYTDLVNEMKSVSPTVATVIGDGTARIRGTLTNAGMETGFFIREIGLFAEDPDDPEAEILYAITYASNPDYLPASGGATAVEQVIDLVVVVSNATNIIVTIDGDHYLTDDDLTAHNADPAEHAPIRAATSSEIDADISTHNVDGDAHPAIRAEIDNDITVHNAEATAHPAIRSATSSEIDSDISAHNADAAAHGLDEFDTDMGELIAAHNVYSSAHTNIQSKIGADIGTHNSDGDAHPAIRAEIDGDITTHDEDNNSHDLATKLAGLQTEIDNDVSAHNGNASAHSAIQTKIGADIGTHNSDGDAHPAIRAEIDSDIATHDADTAAHGIQTQIGSHNTDGGAHADLVSGIGDDINAAVNAHNVNASAHTAIQTKIGTDIAAHNASGASHSDIRTSIETYIKRGAIKTIRDNVTSNITAAVGDRIFTNTSGGAFTVTLPGSGSSAVGDAVEFIDLVGTFGTNNLTIGRNGLKIMGLSENMVCDINNAAFSLIRNSDGWRIGA